MSISGNIEEIRRQISQAAQSTGRRAQDIMLVAATKTQPVHAVREAVAGGVDACGENKVQELSEKLALGAYEGAPVHFIGHLQKNKIKKVVGAVDIIQSVDSDSLLDAINRRAGEIGTIQDVLIQVNIGNDPAKFGVEQHDVHELLSNMSKYDNSKVRGLMTILPISRPESEKRRYFCEMNKLFVDIKAKWYDNVSMDFLSMGMSEDYVQAIQEGANMVRVGSAIFGAR